MFVAITLLIWFVPGIHTGSRSLRKALDYVFPGAIWKHPSCRLDILVYVINLSAIPLGTLALAWVSAPSCESALTRLFGEPAFSIPPGLPCAGVQFCVIATTVGFAEFFQHYLMHRLPVLWAIHRAHHSAEVLNLFTQFRMHPLEVVFAAFLIGSAGGVASGVMMYLSAGDLSKGAATLWGGLMLCRNLVQNFRHSHLWISYGPFLDQFFLSPCMHQIHHSILPRHSCTNLGTILTIWDRLFGTLYVPTQREHLVFGISEIERGTGSPHPSLRAFYIEPLANGMRMLLPRLMCRFRGY